VICVTLSEVDAFFLKVFNLFQLRFYLIELKRIKIIKIFDRLITFKKQNVSVKVWNNGFSRLFHMSFKAQTRF